MATRIHFGGPTRYRLRSAAELSRSILEVSSRRSLKGPRRPSWNWLVEVGTQMLKRHVATAFAMHDVKQARRYLDSLVITSPALSEVNITPVTEEKFRGKWFSSKNMQTGVTVLYFHGGGYSFYPKSYDSFIALIAQAAKARTFALDYRLSPEHRFPAQLEDSLHAYRWLLEKGVDAGNLVVAGDSAGGNLALALLFRARDSNLPFPALAVALSPPTDLETEYQSLATNQGTDWIDKPELLHWAEWFCDSTQLRDPLISPMWADLRGLPPIYIQAGSAEILYDSIQAFVNRAKSQGADVVLEAWEDMNHVFQMFGPDAPQSAEALRRIGEVIDLRIRKRKKMETASAASV
jgi:epsilon-lactone hydrolase